MELHTPGTVKDRNKSLARKGDGFYRKGWKKLKYEEGPVGPTGEIL